MAFRQLILRPLQLSNPNLRLGDMARRGHVIHYVSPFSVRRALRDGGFDVLLFNSDNNLKHGRESTFFTNFSADKCLFFVAKKTRAKR